MRFLVPIDGSTDSGAATTVAFQLASEMPDTQLLGVHVVNVRPASGNLFKDATGYAGFEPAIVSQEFYDSRKAGAQAMVDAFVYRASTAGVTATGKVLEGAVTEQIVAASQQTDLVIMGQRGESEDRFPGQGGAQSANALAQFTVPAILVPKTITRITSIAVGYDASPAAERSLRSVRALAGPLKVPVHLIHVGGDGVAAAEQLRAADESLVGIDCIHHVVPMGENVHQTLVETATAANADLLVLGFSGQSTFKDMVFGSSGEKLLSKLLPIAILVAH